MPISRIAILSALPEELDWLLSRMKVHSKKPDSDFPFWEGNLDGQELILKSTGIGKVNAALTTQHIIRDFQISRVYNFGVAGGISKEVDIGDVVAADKVAQSDFDLTVFGHAKGQIPGFKHRYFMATARDDKIKELQNRQNEYRVHYGTIISADQFVENREMMLELGQEFKAIAKDMESAAIGQVCYLNKIPSSVVRGISDNSGAQAKCEYQKNPQRSISNAGEVLFQLLQK